MQTFLLECVRVNKWSFVEAAEQITANEFGLTKLLSNDSNRPTLFTALQIAGACQQPLLSILESPADAAAQIRFDFQAPGFFRHEHPRVLEDARSGVQLALFRAIYGRSKGAPRSVNAICKAYGVTPGFANYAFPHCVAQISARRRKFMERKKLELQKAAEHAVARWIQNLNAEQICATSQKLVVAQLKKRTSLPKRVLASSLAARLREFNKNSF